MAAVVVFLGVAGFIAGTAGRLPEWFVVHWNLQGAADGWDDKAAFVNLVFLVALALLQRTPSSLIGIPYKRVRWGRGTLLICRAPSGMVRANTEAL